jgi:hypothetical protein
VTLGEALRTHRAAHADCQGCEQYLDLARTHTERRERWSGPRMACTILSVREDAQ